MIKYFLTIFLLFLLFFLYGQETVTKSIADVDLETEFIVAMKDIALEEYDDALVKLRKIKNRVHSDGIVDFEIAKIYLIQDQLDEAKLYVKKAIKKDNSKRIYKQFLVDVFLEQNDYLAAAETTEELLVTGSFIREDYYKIADYYQRAKNTQRAIKILNKLEKITGYSQEIELYKSNIYLRNRDYSKALLIIENLLKNNKDDIKILLKKAMIFRLMNNKEESAKIYQYILSIDPKNSQALSYITASKRFNRKEQNYISKLYPMLENSEIGLDDKIKLLIPFVTEVSKNNPLNNQMIEASLILLKQYPDNAKTNALYADILYNKDEIEKSTKYYKESLKYSKNNFTVWKQLMSIYTLLENWKELAKLSEDAIDYYPNQTSGYYNAGRAFINLNKVEEGIEYLDEAILYSSKSDKFKSEIQLMKAKGFIIQKKSDKAFAILNSLNIDFTQSHPFYWELKGDLERVEGNIEW